ncbi:hypothetical protein BOW52_08360 [Solemya elarraichensis gill symbiont]|uniref:Mg chelatase-related protein C-terminal domain-containing protein n=1 Tax=Solemya elarraichensis gill symbiont TaxID=1918949 RepID=A0A1T2L0F2_9GAMM|nr:hypothetical protein BOW52_08360 [Solemya elarraichensis gill symbiont]
MATGDYAPSILSPWRAAIDKSQKKLLQQAIGTLNISHRAYHRILKLARTICDLDGGESIQTKHLSEAIRLRSLDKNLSTFQ